MRNRLAPFRSRKCQPAFFDPQWYLATYTDVAAAGMNPLRHYLRFGRAEGRLPCFMVAVWRERDFRWGLLENGLARLEAFARRAGEQGTEADRVWAALACAKAAARAGDWIRAAQWLRPLDPERDLVKGFCLPDPMLLAIEVALMVGEIDRAEALWTLAAPVFAGNPDFDLAKANIAAARHGHGADWAAALNRIYSRAGLSAVTLADGPAGIPAFDRLAPVPRWHLPRRQGPLVSVIMPARDAAPTIATALRSLRDQSWRNLEILVVDNGSVDATADIVRASAARDPRIRLLDGRNESGAYGARNLGVAAARGAFITVLDADDWAHPERIERQLRALLRRPARAASLSHWVRTTPDLRFTRWWREDGLVHPDISSLMIRTDVRERLGFWDRARAGADTEYCLRLQAVFGADAIHEVHPGIPLSFGRVRPQSLTQDRETGIETHLFGPRRDYQLAAQRWHKRMQAQGDLPLPQRPARRPFPIPRALALPDSPDPPPAPCDAEWLEQSGLYDDRWYMQTYHDLRALGVDGRLHFEAAGEAEGRDPGPGFSSSGYRQAHGPFEGSALRHYLGQGRANGVSPLPVFAGALPEPAEGRHVLVFGHQAREHVFGAERCLLHLLDRAVAEGVTPSVVLPHVLNREYLEALRARAHEVHVVPFGLLFGGVPPHPETIARLADLIRESGAAEVHQNTVVMDAPLHAARAAGVPSVVHAHELPAEDPQLCIDLGCSASELRAHLLAHATRFVANSRAVLDWLDLPSSQVMLMPNRVASGLSDLPFAPQDPPRVALIGSLVAKKGIADFVTVARLCDRAGVAAQFLMIGPETEDLRKLGPLPANLRHAGYAATPVEAHSQADIVMSLSHVAESFGLTVLEAMTAGRPVICYDRGTPPALLGDSGGGEVVPADDPQAAARALMRLLQDPAAIRAASRNARHRAATLDREAREASVSPGIFLKGS